MGRDEVDAGRVRPLLSRRAEPLQLSGLRAGPQLDRPRSTLNYAGGGLCTVVQTALATFGKQSYVVGGDSEYTCTGYKNSTADLWLYPAGAARRADIWGRGLSIWCGGEPMRFARVVCLAAFAAGLSGCSAGRSPLPSIQMQTSSARGLASGRVTRLLSQPPVAVQMAWLMTDGSRSLRKAS